jgi:hypothetical protein
MAEALRDDGACRKLKVLVRYALGPASLQVLWPIAPKQPRLGLQLQLLLTQQLRML